MYDWLTFVKVRSLPKQQPYCLYCSEGMRFYPNPLHVFGLAATDGIATPIPIAFARDAIVDLYAGTGCDRCYEHRILLFIRCEIF